MSLFVDKYRPKTLEKLSFHKEQAEQLKRMVSAGDFPHLLVYGPPGCGKKTRIHCILRELYGIGAERMKIDHKTFTAPSGKKLEIASVSSNYHVEISPGEVGIYDRVVVQEIIKTMAQTQQLESSTQKEFKMVVLNEVDRLTKDAQHALRRTMEKYTSTCRLILCCRSTSKVIAPLRSRCLPLRIAAPSQQQIVSTLSTVAHKECIECPAKLLERIAEKSNGNLRRALLMLETCHVQNNGSLDEKTPISEPDWELYLRETAQIIVKQQNQEGILKVRERLYEMLSKCIPPSVLFEGLLKELIRSCDASIKPEATAVAADLEHRLQKGSKAIYHLEAFVVHFMRIYREFLESTAMDFE